MQIFSFYHVKENKISDKVTEFQNSAVNGYEDIGIWIGLGSQGTPVGLFRVKVYVFAKKPANGSLSKPPKIHPTATHPHQNLSERPAPRDTYLNVSILEIRYNHPWNY